MKDLNLTYLRKLGHEAGCVFEVIVQSSRGGHKNGCPIDGFLFVGFDVRASNKADDGDTFLEMTKIFRLGCDLGRQLARGGQNEDSKLPVLHWFLRQHLHCRNEKTKGLSGPSLGLGENIVSFEDGRQRHVLYAGEKFVPHNFSNGTFVEVSNGQGIKSGRSHEFLLLRQ